MVRVVRWCGGASEGAKVPRCQQFANHRTVAPRTTRGASPLRTAEVALKSSGCRRGPLGDAIQSGEFNLIEIAAVYGILQVIL